MNILQLAKPANIRILKSYITWINKLNVTSMRTTSISLLLKAYNWQEGATLTLNEYIVNQLSWSLRFLHTNSVHRCVCLSLLSFRCVASCEEPDDQNERNTCHSGCIWRVSLQCVFWSALSVHHFERSTTRSRPTNTCTASHRCVSVDALSGESSWCTPSCNRWSNIDELSFVLLITPHLWPLPLSPPLPLL